MILISHRGNISGKKIELIIGDIRDQKILQKSLEKIRPNCVIHFAGVKSVNESISNPLNYYDINVNGMLSLLKSMMETNCKKIIFSSSATVYGRPDYLPINENHRTVPENPYGETKLTCEKILSDLLNQNLGKFIENIDSKQIGATIFTGKLELKNMKLKETLFDDSPLPFSLKFG